MRRGRMAGEQEVGGAWEYAAIMRAEDSMLLDSSKVHSTPRATGEKEIPCTDGGWPIAA
jgi:hypothetical protein